MNSPGKPRIGGRPGAETALTLVKAVHTLAWFSIESCMMYVLYAGVARRTDRRAAMAGTVVAGEILIFAANGCRCPLTELAEHFGAADGSVTDIWLPRGLAHNLPALHVPLLAAAAYLNGRNLHQRNLGPAWRGLQAGSPIGQPADAGSAAPLTSATSRSTTRAQREQERPPLGRPGTDPRSSRPSRPWSMRLRRSPRRTGPVLATPGRWRRSCGHEDIGI
jgi:hypothetical protein